MEFRVLGPLQVADGGQIVPISSRRQRALLALLVANVGRTVSGERIIEQLWGDDPPDSGREAVAFHVSRLRRALDAPADGGAIQTRDGGYVLAAPPESVDVICFERLAADGHAALAADPEGTAKFLAAALELWRGEPYEGLDDLPFAAEEVRRLTELRLRATEDRLEAEIALGRHAAAVAELEALVGREPLREHLRGLLMIALYRCGRQADALRAYHDGRRVLVEELGVDPGPELAALEAAVLRHDPALLKGPPGSATAPSQGGIARPPLRNPYKGLRPFGEADAPDFFGRERLTAHLVERLGEVARADGLLAVVGPSGSGKSSVVRAGLIPALRSGALPGSEGWVIATLSPGTRPFDELAAALRAAARAAARAIETPSAAELAAHPDVLGEMTPRLLGPDGRLVIVVDQLEEMDTLPDATRDAFVDVLTRGLATAEGRVAIVITLRADHLDSALRSAALGRLLRDGTELVPPLRQDELERAIARPAGEVGLTLEPGLVERIVADVVDRPAMLPLLQYALTELAERSDDGRLTRAMYDAIGGVLGALAGRAEAVYAALAPDERDAARQVFLSLVAVEPTGEAGARRAPRARVDEPAAEAAVLERFGRARLLVHGRDTRTGDPTVEIAHEALLVRWPRLVAWIEDEREAIWMRRRVGEAAAEWLAKGRDPGFLLTGGRLETFASWAASTDLRLGAAERDLLEASLAERRRGDDAEATRRAEEGRLERRGTRWLRGLVLVLAVAALVSTGLLALVWRQSEAAAEERAIAAARELAVAANGRLQSDPGLAALLAMESARATTDRGWITEETMDSLHWAIQSLAIPYPVRDLPVAVRLAPDGPRGVFLVPPAELLGMATQVAAWRALTPAECRAHLHRAQCPTTAIARGDADLRVMTPTGTVPVERFAGSGTAGASVRVLSQMPIDPTAMLAPFAAGSATTVVVVQSDGGPNLAGEVAMADVAILARPGDVIELARTQLLVDLRATLRAEEVAAIADAPLADVGWVGGRSVGPGADGTRLAGVPLAAMASSLLWYPAEAFAAAGYEPPATQAELRDLVRRMVDAGRRPWCMGLAGGGAAVDWVEDQAIAALERDADASEADAWLGLDSAAFAASLLDLNALLVGGNAGDQETTIRTRPEEGAALMGDGPEPRCWLIHAEAAAADAWESPVRPDLRVVPFPLGDGPTELRGRVFTLVVRRDRPEVRAMVRELLGSRVAESLALDEEGWLLPLGPSAETAWDSRTVTGQGVLAGAIRGDRFWLDASDRMPWSLGEEAVPAAVLRVAGAPRAIAGTRVAAEVAELARITGDATP
jgi:DNA-binding SARP family transcriptional activator